MSIYKAGKIGLATAKIYHRSSKFGTKHYKIAVKAIKALKAKATTPGWVKSKSISIGSKVEKHIGRHPKKYIAGASALAGAGVYSKHQSLKKDGTHARLKKELKKKGYI